MHKPRLLSYNDARHYWFEFDLLPALVREGRNAVVVHLAQRFAPLPAERVLHQVELRLAYKQPPRPAGGQV